MEWSMQWELLSANFTDYIWNEVWVQEENWCIEVIVTWRPGLSWAH